jgi:hypothetical protein
MTTVPHTRHIQAAPSRLSRFQAEPLAKPRKYSQRIFPFQAEPQAEPIEYSPEYSLFNPSELPDVQNRFLTDSAHF